MNSITCQSDLRPALPQIKGCKDYRNERQLLIRIDTFFMKMTAKFRTKDGRKHRKAVLREMKKLSKRVAKHARNHLKLLKIRHQQIDLTKGQVRQISY